MLRATTTHGDHEVVVQLNRLLPVGLNLAAVLHQATVRIVPVEAPPLNFTVNVSPFDPFNVSADP
jgi:hypothetical protein